MSPRAAFVAEGSMWRPQQAIAAGRAKLVRSAWHARRPASRPVILRAVTLALALAFTASAHAAEAWETYNQGIARKKAGDLAGAETLFRQCLDEDPKYARCHFSLGVILKGKNDLGGALDHFKKAVAEAPTWGQARLSLATTLIKQEQFDAAMPELEEALKDPKLDPEDKAETYNQMGVVHRQAKRWDDAVKAFDQAIAIKPNDGRYYIHKALAQQMLKDLDAMEKTAKKATELSPKEPLAWQTLAIAYARQKRVGDALNAWRKVTELDPKSSRGWYGRGEAAEQNGNKQEAKEAFEKVLTLVPPNETQDVRDRIKRLE